MTVPPSIQKIAESESATYDELVTVIRTLNGQTYMWSQGYITGKVTYIVTVTKNALFSMAKSTQVSVFHNWFVFEKMVAHSVYHDEDLFYKSLHEHIGMNNAVSRTIDDTLDIQ